MNSINKDLVSNFGLNGFLYIGGSNFRISACRFIITRFLYAGFHCTNKKFNERQIKLGLLTSWTCILG